MTQDDLKKFRADRSSCDLVVLVDAAAGTVLMSDSAIRLGQEQLDALCDTAGILFQGAEPVCATAILSDPFGSRIFLRVPGDGTEVLCCRFGPLADLTDLQDAATRLLAAGGV